MGDRHVRGGIVINIAKALDDVAGGDSHAAYDDLRGSASAFAAFAVREHTGEALALALRMVESIANYLNNVEAES